MKKIHVTACDREILRIAIPSIVSNITVPLLGLVDVAITGHLGSAAYIGAIAVGGMLFNVMYWLFAFLRMSTSGLTSQALGRRDVADCRRLLRRSLLMALVLSGVLLLLQVPIRELGLYIMSPTDEVRRLTTIYFNICIWGAPASLSLFALNGWFIGMQNSRSPMLVAIVQNIMNIVVSLLLVYVLGMKVEGVATGTLVAQWGGFLMALGLSVPQMKATEVLAPEVQAPEMIAPLSSPEMIAPLSSPEMIAPLSSPEGDTLVSAHKTIEAPSGAVGGASTSGAVGGASTSEASTSGASSSFFLFLRTLCLVSVLLFFTSAGSRQGEVVLAVNTLLMQLYLLVSYVMDGFANAAEAMSGKYWGARDMDAFHHTVRHCFLWGMVCAVAFTLLYIIGGQPFLRLLTDEVYVVGASQTYIGWAWLVPVCSLAAFIWDGVFVGITAARQMLTSSFLAAVIFFAVYAVAVGPMGNHGLWLAFICYMLTRGIVQTLQYRLLMRRA